MASLLDDRMRTREYDVFPQSNLCGVYESSVLTPTGLRVFYPERFSSVLTSNVNYVRRALRRDGVVIVSGVASNTECEIFRQSLVMDICRSLSPDRFVNQSLPHPDTRLNPAILSIMNSVEPNCTPPTEWVPDGIMEDHRWPLTVSSQVRRLHSGVRNTFSKLYDVSPEELAMQPDNARVTFSSITARGGKRINEGQSPRDAFSRVLNNAFMPPHRLNSHMGYGLEFQRAMENEVLDFGVMGSLMLTTSRVDAHLENATSPGFVCAPGILSEPDRSPGDCASKKYQQLSDDEIEMLRTRWAFVPCVEGDLLLWHRNLPHAWKAGDRTVASSDVRSNPNKVWQMSFAEQRISWVPKRVHPPTSSLSSKKAFTTCSKRHRMCEMRKRRYHVNGKRRRTAVLKDIPKAMCVPLRAQIEAL